MEILNKINQWQEDRNFFGEGGATVQSQFCKLIEEAGELAGNIARGRDCKDDIGDILVVLNGIARLSGTTLEECAETAYNDIKDRCGEWRNGSFVKEADLL